MGVVLIALFDVGRSSLKLRDSLILDPSLCKRKDRAVVAYAFNPSTWEAEAGGSS